MVSIHPTRQREAPSARRRTRPWLLRSALRAALLTIVPLGAAATDGAVAWRTTVNVPAQGSMDYSASVIQPDGRLIVAAAGPSVDSGCAARRSVYLWRLTAQGALDPQFGDAATPGRKLLLGLCNESLLASSLAIDRQGRIVIAGTRGLADGRLAVIVMRLLPNGALDTGFADNGALTWLRNGTGGQLDVGYSLVVEQAPPSRLFVGALRRTGDVYSTMYFSLSDSGQPSAWGNASESDGRQYQSESFPRPFHVCVGYPDGLIGEPGDGLRALVRVLCQVVGGGGVSETPFLLRLRRSTSGPAQRLPFRFAAEPQLDTDGYLPAPHRYLQSAFANEPDGTRSWVVAGGLRPTGPDEPFRVGVAALDAEGQLDTGVLGGTGRRVYSPPGDYNAFALVVQVPGRVIVGGRMITFNGGAAAFRIVAGTGAIDTTFGSDGSGFILYPDPVPAGEFAFTAIRAMHRYAGSDDYAFAGQGRDPAATPNPFALRIRGDASRVFANGFESP